MVLNTNHSDNSFSKTICSICYEDLKPIIEDLQSISICGHVFHELWYSHLLESHIYLPFGLTVEIYVISVLETLACSSGSSILLAKRNVVVRFVSRVARRKMSVGFIFSRLEIKMNRRLGISRLGIASRRILSGCMEK